MRRSFQAFLVAALVAFAMVPPSPAHAQDAGGNDESRMTLGTMFEKEQFIGLSGFTSAVRMSGIVDSLKATGPFTVLAFSNEAANDAAAFLRSTFPQPEKSPEFRNLVEYHVIQGRKLLARDFSTVDELTTRNGKILHVETKGTTYGNQSKQPKTIILTGKNKARIPDDQSYRNLGISQASNGIVHTIDTVLKPPQQ